MALPRIHILASGNKQRERHQSRGNEAHATNASILRSSAIVDGVFILCRHHRKSLEDTTRVVGGREEDAAKEVKFLRELNVFTISDTLRAPAVPEELNTPHQMASTAWYPWRSAQQLLRNYSPLRAQIQQRT
jgi:hypothetical protein